MDKRLRNFVVLWFLFLAVLAVLCATSAEARIVQLESITELANGYIMVSDGTDTTWFDTATDTVRSPPIFIGNSDGYFGLWYQFSSTAGSPNVKMEYLESYCDDTSTFAVPDPEDPIVAAETTETIHIPEQLRPVPHDYIMFQIVGLSGNATDTTLKLIFRRRRPKFYEDF